MKTEKRKNQMQTLVFEGILTALSSISHNGGQSFGVNSKLRREKFVQPDHSVEDIPVLSGNGMRGMLRDRGMAHMCRVLGYGENGSGLSLPAFHFLFSGGSLTSGKSIDIAEARRMRALIPLVGVFGGALGNSILPGILKCGKAIPICRETAHLIPSRFIPEKVASIWDYIQEEMYTRKDDSKNERLRRNLDSLSRMMLEANDVQNSSKSATAPVEETGVSTQMMYYSETIVAGTQLYWKIVLDDATDLEFEAFLQCLIEFSKTPYVGGKSNVGMGEVAINFDSWVRIDSRLDTGTSVAAPIGRLYHEHIKTNAEAIRVSLNGVK
jgi:CRISPR type IV-associated protein Csf2